MENLSKTKRNKIWDEQTIFSKKPLALLWLKKKYFYRRKNTLMYDNYTSFDASKVWITETESHFDYKEYRKVLRLVSK